MKPLNKIGITLVLLSTCAVSGPSIFIGGGANMSSTTAVDSLSATKSFRPGFNTAIGFEQYFSRHVSLITGLSIETRGEKTESTTDIGPDSIPIISNIKSAFNFLYLQVPLFVQYNFPLGPGKINLFAGPELGIMLVGEAQTIDNTTIPGVALPTTLDTMDLAKQLSTTDAGVSAGIGYELSLGQSSFFCRPSYYRGLLDYFTDGPKGVLSNIKVFVGYKFTFSQ